MRSGAQSRHPPELEVLQDGSLDNSFLVLPPPTHQVGPVVHRHEEERPHVRHRLHDPVHRVEGEPGERAEGVLLVVDVVDRVHALVAPLDVVHLAVLPVHPELDRQLRGAEAWRVRATLLIAKTAPRSCQVTTE